MFSERYGWKPIDTAPIDQDVALIVTDGGGPWELHSPFQADRGRLGQLWQGDAACRHALAVEAILCPPKETMTARRFPPPARHRARSFAKAPLRRAIP
jgi:hypothetical protein